jgi:hypothetical protein
MIGTRFEGNGYGLFLLLILGFHDGSLFILTLLLCGCTEWMRALYAEVSLVHTDSIFSVYFNLFCYLTTLSVWRICSVGDRMINAYGTVGGMRIGRRN